MKEAIIRILQARFGLNAPGINELAEGIAAELNFQGFGKLPVVDIFAYAPYGNERT